MDLRAGLAAKAHEVTCRQGEDHSKPPAVCWKMADSGLVVMEEWFQDKARIRRELAVRVPSARDSLEWSAQHNDRLAGQLAAMRGKQ